ncbi:MAG: hypothetical protein LW837_21970 [Roseomonas sp.]|nr:hypothetical protein [Roseomonas sp.]
MNTILPTENQDWGFWGTMRDHAAEAWPIAFTAIHNATSTDPASVRAFLDSRYGRHFADGVNSQMHYGASLQDAIAKTTAEWMGWRITQRTSRETGIPAGQCRQGPHRPRDGYAAQRSLTARHTRDRCDPQAARGHKAGSSGGDAPPP